MRNTSVDRQRRLGTFRPSAAAMAICLVLALAPGALAGPTRVDGPPRDQGWTSALTTGVGPDVVRRQIGTSVQHRPIYAYRLGDPKDTTKAVVLGNLHGDEPAGGQVVQALINGDPILGVDLWVIPTANPDGLAAHTRQNAHGVDLNRNWSYLWQHETGRYNSGPHPFSEPESRAVRNFIHRIDPNYIVSFHQPLHGVDSDQPKNRHLMYRLARNLHLPTKPFTCQTGVCHGTMTGWFNFHHAGACITVEFGSAPTHDYLTRIATPGTVRSVLGHY